MKEYYCNVLVFLFFIYCSSSTLVINSFFHPSSSSSIRTIGFWGSWLDRDLPVASMQWNSFLHSHQLRVKHSCSTIFLTVGKILVCRYSLFTKVISSRFHMRPQKSHPELQLIKSETPSSRLQIKQAVSNFMACLTADHLSNSLPSVRLLVVQQSSSRPRKVSSLSPVLTYSFRPDVHI